MKMIEISPRPTERLINIGQVTTFSNGVRAEAIIENPLERRKASGKSKHEVIHGLMDPRNVRLIDIDPIDEPGAEAVTYFKTTPNEEAMAGPDAMGMAGTGFDMDQLALRGVNPQGARFKARIKMKEMERYLDPAADYVEYHRNISGGQLLRVMERVDNGNDVRIKITNPDGTVEVRTIRGVDFFAQTIEVPMDEGHEYFLKPNSENEEESVEGQDETIKSIERFLYGDTQQGNDSLNSAENQIEPKEPELSEDIESERLSEIRAQLSELINPEKV